MGAAGGVGRITDASVIRSIPLLDDAALDAVRQWEFEPVDINGIGRVPIIAALSVSFKLPVAHAKMPLASQLSES